MTTTEFGVQYRAGDEIFVRGDFTERGARHLVASLGGEKPTVQRPTPVAVMRREIGPWRPVDEENE